MTQVTENKVVAAPVPMTPFQEFWHYFKRNKGAVIGLVYVTAMILIAIFANEMFNRRAVAAGPRFMSLAREKKDYATISPHIHFDAFV